MFSCEVIRRNESGEVHHKVTVLREAETDSQDIQRLCSNFIHSRMNGKIIMNCR